MLVVCTIGLVVLASCSTGRTTPSINLSPPAVPNVLTSEIVGWGDVTIASLCLTVEAEGALTDPAEPRKLVADIMSALGASITSEGCDADLAVKVSARKVSGTYAGKGVCYSGSEGSATATLTQSGRPPVQGSYAKSRKPPVAVQSCSKDQSVDLGDWMPLLAEGSGEADPGALVELFGSSIWPAFGVIGLDYWPSDEYERSFEKYASAVLANDKALTLITASLAKDDREARLRAATFAERLAEAVGVEKASALKPAVPYVIRALALEDAWEQEHRGEVDDGEGDVPEGRHRLGETLERITGEKMAARADLWWSWWQEQ